MEYYPVASRNQIKQKKYYCSTKLSRATNCKTRQKAKRKYLGPCAQVRPHSLGKTDLRRQETLEAKAATIFTFRTRPGADAHWDKSTLQSPSAATNRQGPPSKARATVSGPAVSRCWLNSLSWLSSRSRKDKTWRICSIPSDVHPGAVLSRAQGGAAVTVQLDKTAASMACTWLACRTIACRRDAHAKRRERQKQCAEQ